MKWLFLSSLLIISRSSIAQKSILEQILYYGTLAPSSHNAQMWKLRPLSDTTVEILYDTTRSVPQVDPYHRESWISLGAFAENCIMAAHDKGWDTELSETDEGLLLRLKKANRAEKDEFISFILKRNTYRKPFLKTSLSPDEVEEWIKPFEKQISFYPLHSAEGQKIASIAYEATEAQLNESGKLKELSEWISTSCSEEQRRKDGLTPRTLGLNFIERLLFRLFFSKESIRKKNFVKNALKDARKQLTHCAGFFLVKTETSEKNAWIHAGRILQRFWIQATQRQIAVHPMSQAIEEKFFYEKLKQELNLQNVEIQMILRVGQVKEYPKPYSKRRSLKEITIHTD